ncbi:MAG: Oxygen-independent coproporphyrinogen-III oxidase-like protein YqeR [Elusimicrobia bacterium]|nr:Oxygen-independent coproporphyrinogen-III oxidase-like protein YqeR [Elusimicrobiota bacterium]
MKPIGLYVHIPFCDAKCHYCDFVTFTDRSSQITPYLEAVYGELSIYKGWPVRTLFIGGGTPTVLSPSQIEVLLSTIHSTMDTRLLTEATVEANPESATLDRLAAYRNGGINRLSFGLQSTNNALLKKMGRLHDIERFFHVYELARSLGFENINVDLMFGLPEQSLLDWEETLDRIRELSPEHVSTYALKIEPGTKFSAEGFKVNGDLEADMYLLASQKLRNWGYEHYEISNFAKPGKESRHNLLYWENQDTLGVGVSSTSYLGGRRFKNTTHLQTYLEASAKGQSVCQEETVLERGDRERETLMLNLRLKRGVASHLLDPLQLPIFKTFLDQGLAVLEKGMYSLTPKGWLLSNLLFQQLV